MTAVGLGVKQDRAAVDERVVKKKDFVKYVLKTDKLPVTVVEEAVIQIVAPVIDNSGVKWKPVHPPVAVNTFEPRAFAWLRHGDRRCARGAGVALGRRPLVDALLKSRQLVAPLKGETASMRAYFVIVDPAARAKPAVRPLEAWLSEQAALES